jgi:hypothetical protein
MSENKSILSNSTLSKGMRCLALALLFGWQPLLRVAAQSQSVPAAPSRTECRVEPLNYKGWQAQQISNRWVQLVVIPQNGGRMIQVSFNGHPYLFVNPKYAGKYLPPDPEKWFNYGGDKLWLLPEGNHDEQHWVGNSDAIDDGAFSFRKLSEGKRCEIELTGIADPQTGIQFIRTIEVDSDSPRIRFHATMKNATGHTVEWSMQSVSQYDTSDHGSSGEASSGHASSDPGAAHLTSRLNHNFWTFTPANPSSSYLNRYHVRFGPAENHAVEVRDDGLFTVHYVHMAAELWLDSTDGWLTVVDGATGYAMVERFQYERGKDYPGKASVIFWTNGPEMRLSGEGEPSLSGNEEDAGPYYLEAELNSPLCRLRPGESCSFETEWFPTRGGSEFHGVTDAGIILRPLECVYLQSGKIRFTGSFGVFFSGRLVAHFYSEHGSGLGTMPISDASPTEELEIEKEIVAPANSARVSLHLEDENGLDRGALQEVNVAAGDKH